MTEDELHQERLAMYKIAVDDIRDAKHQQWRIIQLTLLAIVALVTVNDYFSCRAAACSLRVVVFFVGAIGIIFIWSFAYSLCRFQNKKKRYMAYFDKAVTQIIEKREEHIINGLQTSEFFASIFTIFIIIAVCIAWLVIK
jgi:predicted ferric reductase